MIWNDTPVKPIVVTVSDQTSLMSDLSNKLIKKQGFSVATLNLDHTVKLRNDPVFEAAYAAHSHVTADGRPVVWLSGLAGQPISLVAGSELIDPLMAQAAKSGVPVGFFGASQAALDGAAAELTRRYPELNIVYHISPPMGFDPTGAVADEAIREIGASGAQVVLLALGAPKQEIFAARAQAALPQTGFVSIGAGLDFLAGTQKRAPRWARLVAAEWLWRLLQNPRRMAGRYAACFAILPRLTLRAVRSRFQQNGTS